MKPLAKALLTGIKERFGAVLNDNEYTASKVQIVISTRRTQTAMPTIGSVMH